jgi:hypothetical protein
VPWAAFRASFRASIWAVIFTQCAATKMTQIDLLKTPTGLPRGTEKNAQRKRRYGTD